MTLFGILEAPAPSQLMAAPPDDEPNSPSRSASAAYLSVAGVEAKLVDVVTPERDETGAKAETHDANCGWRIVACEVGPAFAAV